uniref:MSP domain-containing protein n=1 Tax=Noctiluca scintillans TaxID=2966 RepID=A0A7S1AN21_NOCSC
MSGWFRSRAEGTRALVEVSPSKRLTFITPESFDEVVPRPISSLTVTNVVDCTVNVQVQVTATAFYTVRPARCTLQPGQVQEVSITIRSSRYNARRDVFRVQASVPRTSMAARSSTVFAKGGVQFSNGVVQSHTLGVCVKRGAATNAGRCLPLLNILRRVVWCAAFTRKGQAMKRQDEQSPSVRLVEPPQVEPVASSEKVGRELSRASKAVMAWQEGALLFGFMKLILCPCTTPAVNDQEMEVGVSELAMGDGAAQAAVGVLEQADIALMMVGTGAPVRSTTASEEDLAQMVRAARASQGPQNRRSLSG